MEKRTGETITEAMQFKENRPSDVTWQTPVKRNRLEELTKNLAVAAALVICVAALRNGAVPSASSMTEAVMTAATGDTLLDDHLGRLTFVSKLFPEATLVFGEAHEDASLLMPVTGAEVVHAWNEAEPYTAWQATERMVYSAIAGEVMGVYHGENEEQIVHVQREDGLSCLCGNMAKVLVTTGDAVEEGALLGYLAEDAVCWLEVRQDGWSVDPASMFSE